MEYSAAPGRVNPLAVWHKRRIIR